MTAFDFPDLRAAASRIVGLFSIVLISAALIFTVLSTVAPPARAGGELWAKFCPEHDGYMWLDPAWTGIYRCDGADSVSGYGRDQALIATWERAGCVDYADVWHNLIDSWVCVGKNTQYGGIKIRQDGGWYRGVIRNNNLTYGAHFYGLINW